MTHFKVIWPHRAEIGNRKSEIGNRQSAICNRHRQSEIGNKVRSHLRDVDGYVGCTQNALYLNILSCMWGGGIKVGREGDDRVGELSNRAISSL